MFWNRQDLLLIMGTEILKIGAEMAEKIEVEVGTFNHRNHFSAFLSVFKWGLPTSTSIFSAISSSIFKISVPMIKRIS